MSNPEIDALRAAIAARPKAADLAEMRRGIDARGLANKLADDVTVEPVTAAGVKAEWTSTPNAAANRAILYFHGGGFVIGSLDSHRHAVAEMGRAAASRVLAVLSGILGGLSGHYRGIVWALSGNCRGIVGECGAFVGELWPS